MLLAKTKWPYNQALFLYFYGGLETSTIFFCELAGL
jgi:hypothetical protein